MGMMVHRNLGRRTRRDPRSYAPVAEINVTPFVDVMLVLLIVFMVTAPMLTVGINVDLPSAKAGKLPSSTEPVVITIDDQGTLFLGESEISSEALVMRLVESSGKERDSQIYIRADAGIGYGVVVEVMATLQKAGFSRLSLVTRTKER